jgi:hypothetical protein
MMEFHQKVPPEKKLEDGNQIQPFSGSHCTTYEFTSRSQQHVIMVLPASIIINKTPSVVILKPPLPILDKLLPYHNLVLNIHNQNVAMVCFIISADVKVEMFSFSSK